MAYLVAFYSALTPTHRRRREPRGRTSGDFLVSGEKTFITGGAAADFITLGCRTGDTAEEGGGGAGGISLLLVETEQRPDGSSGVPGLTRTKLDKMGWHCSDTAHLHFDEVGESSPSFGGYLVGWDVG